MHRLDHSICISEIGDCFSANNGIGLDFLPVSVKNKRNNRFCQLTAEPNVTKVISQARRLQRQLRRIWSEHRDKVTLTACLGLVVMDEDTTPQHACLVVVRWVQGSDL
jgi:hypothetical protein